MNYYGITLDESLSEETIDKALMKVGEDGIIPVRGPKEFVNFEHKYTFEVSGTIDYFDGVESIYKNNQKVYVLKCHGGAIKR